MTRKMKKMSENDRDYVLKLEGQGDYCSSNLDEYLDAFEAAEVARFVGKLIRGRPKPKTIEERLEAIEKRLHASDFLSSLDKSTID
jgi:hypothetical protein